MEPALLASFAAVLVAFGIVSRRMERGVVTPPMVVVGLGIGLGQLGSLEPGRELLGDLADYE